MGYEQSEVAQLLGFTSHARISEWEQGRAMPSAKNLLQLSIVYSTLPDELYYELRQELVREISVRQQQLYVIRNNSG